MAQIAPERLAHPRSLSLPMAERGVAVLQIDLEMLPPRVAVWRITRHDDIPNGWRVVSRHGNYVGLVEEGEPDLRVPENSGARTSLR